MRLINADYLKSILNGGGSESVNINISKRMPLSDIVDTVIFAYRKCLFAELEKAPTAYDVDKVVERLESMQDITGWDLLTVQECLKIVKSGGIG